MKKYAAALREAAEHEKPLIGGLMLESEAFGPAMTGRAERVESVMKHYERGI
jgi:hypothetical protein